jgi:predicted acylesterase/phospholipase RssA
MTITTHTLAAATVPLTAIAGSKLGSLIASAGHAPDWLSPLLGPAGALFGTVLAVRWLLKRLDKSEAKHEVRDDERIRSFEQLVKLTVQGQQIIEQNSAVLAEVKEALRK